MNRRRFLKSTACSLAVLPFYPAPAGWAFGVESGAGANAGRPNTLFCIVDDASSHFGACGCDWTRTPGLDRVARQGVLFTKACTACWISPTDYDPNLID